MDVLSVEQFDTDYLEKIFSLAEAIEQTLKDKKAAKDLVQKHSDKQICTLFYEPSTRTRLSFETAALKLGMGVVSTENAAGFSSAAKGETLEDTINVLNNYGLSAIIIRHTDNGAAERAASVSRVPIINAGDGTAEHPTQALLDAYTIKKTFRTVGQPAGGRRRRPQIRPDHTLSLPPAGPLSCEPCKFYQYS